VDDGQSQGYRTVSYNLRLDLHLGPLSDKISNGVKRVGARDTGKTGMEVTDRAELDLRL
jgi:hypothetical protein